MARKYNYITYHDTKKDKVGAIEDDHLGVEKMIKSRPGWVIKGYVCAESAANAIWYTETTLMEVKTKRRKRK